VPAVVPVELQAVRLELPANQPVVLLRELEGRHRVLPIYIGNAEAASIAYKLEGVVPPRPLTHDLFVDTLTALGATLERIVVTEMREHTYFAELHLVVNGVTHTVSSRPSDSICLAVRVGCPMFVEDAVLDEAGQEPEPDDAEDAAEEADEILDEFREFIENVNPEDFMGS
jgi:bifunctional DNase/RNase